MPQVLKFPPPYDTWIGIKEATKLLTTVTQPEYTRRLVIEGKLTGKKFQSTDGKVVRWLIDPDSIERYNNERAADKLVKTVVLHSKNISRADIEATLLEGLGQTASDRQWLLQEPITKKKKAGSLTKQEDESDKDYTLRLMEALDPE